MHKLERARGSCCLRLGGSPLGRSQSKRQDSRSHPICLRRAVTQQLQRWQSLPTFCPHPFAPTPSRKIEPQSPLFWRISAPTGSIDISVTVENTGTVSGVEVVQLYVSDTATGLVRPLQELAGFHRISLAPGAAQTVTFSVRMDQLAYLGLDGKTFTMEAGPVDVLVGSASDDIRARASFEVTGPTVELGRSRSYLSESRVR